MLSSARPIATSARSPGDRLPTSRDVSNQACRRASVCSAARRSTASRCAGSTDAPRTVPAGCSPAPCIRRNETEVLMHEGQPVAAELHGAHRIGQSRPAHLHRRTVIGAVHARQHLDQRRLPDPFWPTNPWISPDLTSKSTARRTCDPECLVQPAHRHPHPDIGVPSFGVLVNVRRRRRRLSDAASEAIVSASSKSDVRSSMHLQSAVDVECSAGR